MLDYLRELLGDGGLAPHGFCLLWKPELIWTHVVSDALIGVSYFSIPIAIATFLTRRRDVSFSWVVWMFAIFITSCGLTHFASIWTLWRPDYGAEALVKLVTAAASVATAVALWPLLPRAIALPSPAQLRLVNADLVTRIGERDAALDALRREQAERQRAEEMLRQSQKLQAIGQLTGGIAHDFNNLLQVVSANLERGRKLAGGDGRLERAFDSAAQGVERAARLTGQLLAFSRQQPLMPGEHDASDIAATALALAGTAIGDRIITETVLARGLSRVHVDRGQMENALINLIVNARDAMPDGGTLRLSTRAETDDAGRDQVVVEVADTGVGMDEATVARAFDPFFTTKPVGAGTGLGLSQVYGFARQSGGSVAIDSRPGEGTRVRLVLPALA